MNLREEARKVGGDKLVEQLDAAAKLETQVRQRLNAIAEEVLEGKEGEDERMALCAMCEALSTLFANCSALAAIKAFNGDRSQGLMVAIKSISANMNLAYENIDAMAGGVESLINSAAKKHGPLPKGE